MTPTGDAHVDAVLAAPHKLHARLPTSHAAPGLMERYPPVQLERSTNVQVFQTQDMPSGMLWPQS